MTAPQHHNVYLLQPEIGKFEAHCHECQESGSGSQAEMLTWKTRHEADADVAVSMYWMTR